MTNEPQRSALTDFQREVTRVFFGLSESYGYVLVGGAALLAHDLVERPTRDLDFFNVMPGVDRSVTAAAAAFAEACSERGWACTRARELTTFVRLIVQSADSLEIDIAIDTPIFDEPLHTQVAPTPSWLDLAAMKLLAMCSRYEARDYVDVFSLHRVVTREALTARARAADRGFHSDWLAEALRMMRRIPDDLFPVPTDEVAELRQFFEQWLNEIELTRSWRRPLGVPDQRAPLGRRFGSAASVALPLGQSQEEVVSDQAREAADDREGFDPHAIQEKWLPVWDELAPFRSGNADDARPKKYVLDMFPYPSGDLHMGHAEAYALGDVLARYWVQRGFNVMHPIGWDAFGLPAENAAIKRGENPRSWTYENIAQQKASMRRYACSFDWDRVLNTCDPEYYRWNQWLFLQMFNKGLAYRKDSAVNWCPSCQTVLANEQVVGGNCERCDGGVTKRKLNQWYLRITDYAQRLLDDMSQLEAGWPEKVLLMQRNWIGRSAGARVDFQIEGREQPVTVFTTRPDTLYGATFMIVAVDAPLAAELAAQGGSSAEHAEYLEQVRAASDIERQATDRPKTGVALNVVAVNPVNGERIPVWASDYVLADYGTGAIMAVPAHDQRDLDFALKFGLPVKVVVEGEADPAATGIATADDGLHINSGPLDGLGTDDAVVRIIEVLRERGTGEAAVNYRLRDWLISRQRYWGTPIPIIHCDVCGEVAVPEDQLPVQLPDLAGDDLRPKGVSPLAAATDWVNTSCPQCGGAATRDADTMDTFFDSSWYFLRYLDPQNQTAAFDPALAKQWLPVEQYVGGVTHAILHLLYARFFTKVLHDLGYVEFTEPFTRLLNQGMVQMDGSAMSKSRGNLVRLSDELDSHGVDAIRLSMVFAGPPEDDIDWADVSPAGSRKFLARAWRLSGDVTSAPGTDVTTGDVALRKVTHKIVHECAQAVESYRFNVVVARVMELVNATRKAIDTGCGGADPAVREAAEATAILLSLVAPYTAEEMWARLGHEPTVMLAGWPEVDPALLVADAVTCVIQINGKLRDRFDVAPDISEADLREQAMARPAVGNALAGTAPSKVIVRAPKLVSIVVDGA